MPYVRAGRFGLAVIVAALLIAVPRAEVIEQILVKVNGEIFTKTDLEGRQVQMLRQRNQQLDLKSADDRQLKKALDDITPELLVSSIDECAWK